MPRRATRRPPARSASAWRPRARARRTWSRPIADALHGLGADRGDHRPGRPARRSAPTPSRRPTSAASRCRSPSTTSWSPTAADIPRAIAEAFHLAATGRPGPVLVDLPKDVLQAHLDLQLAARRSTCPATARSPARTASRSARRPRLIVAAQASGPLRRRRRPQGAGDRASCAQLAELTGHPGGHDADGARRLPGQPPAAPRHARHARLGRRGHGPAEVRPADRAGHPLRRPGHRQALDASRRTRRSSTPTSTRPRSARTAPPTCRSWATAAR